MTGAVHAVAANAGRAAWRRARLGAASLLALGAAVLAFGQAGKIGPIGAGDLAGGAQALITKRFLANRHHVMQSFAFNNTNGEIYAVQVEGADALGSWEQHSAHGDLELTRLSADGKTVLGHMGLEGFGHGVSIGVEPAGADVYLWTEADSRPNAEGAGRGSRLGRFRFADGQTLRSADPSVAKYAPIPDAEQVTPSVNLADGVLMERYLSAAQQFRLALFRLTDVKAGGHPVPRHDVAMPTGLGTFQGYCTQGDRVYLFTGEAYGAGNPPPGNAELSCVDWSTGRIVARTRTDIFGEQIHREPEGMAIRLDATRGPLLCFGFASSLSPQDGRRVISIAGVPLASRLVPARP